MTESKTLDDVPYKLGMRLFDYERESYSIIEVYATSPVAVASRYAKKSNAYRAMIIAIRSKINQMEFLVNRLQQQQFNVERQEMQEKIYDERRAIYPL